MATDYTYTLGVMYPNAEWICRRAGDPHNEMIPQERKLDLGSHVVDWVDRVVPKPTVEAVESQVPAAEAELERQRRNKLALKAFASSWPLDKIVKAIKSGGAEAQALREAVRDLVVE